MAGPADPVADPRSVTGSGGAGKPSSTSNLVLRIASAAVMMPVAIGAAYWGGWAFAAFWAIAGLAVLWEWTTLVSGRDQRAMFFACAGAIAVGAGLAWHSRPISASFLIGLGALIAIILAPRGQRGWIAAGVGYAGALMLAPIVLRGSDWTGFIAIVLLFAIVWTTDVLAYFTGRALGGPKLMPSVSPKKTWSGAIGGTLCAVVVAVLVARGFGDFNLVAIAVLAFVLSAFSQTGDLLESHIKRVFGAKDASTLIPGHGGVMDRLDGFWAAAVVACAIGVARGGLEDTARGLLMW